MCIDATKALHSVHYGKLFKELINRNHSPRPTVIIHLLHKSKLQVKRSGTISNKFPVKNSVKLRGVL